jgi:hypothetical protein
LVPEAVKALQPVLRLKRRRGGGDIDGVTARPRDPLPVLRGTPRAETALWIVLAVAASLAMIWGWSWNVMLNDYAVEAAPSFAALLHGHIATFLQTAPAHGATFLLRAPFALPGSLNGAGTLLIDRLSALPCLLAIPATLTLAALAAVVYRLGPIRRTARTAPLLSRAPAVPS